MDAANQVEPHEGFVDTPNGKLHYLDWRGPDPQIHFLHANGFCAGTYSPFIKHLVNEFHIFAATSAAMAARINPISSAFAIGPFLHKT